MLSATVWAPEGQTCTAGKAEGAALITSWCVIAWLVLWALSQHVRKILSPELKLLNKSKKSIHAKHMVVTLVMAHAALVV